MTKRFFSHDPFTGVTQWFEGDGNGGFKMHYESDVTDNLEANQALMNTGWDGYVSKARELKWVAEIPMSLVMKWKIEEGVDILEPGSEEFMKRKLNSSEWLKLRVGPGRI